VGCSRPSDPACLCLRTKQVSYAAMRLSTEGFGHGRSRGQSHVRCSRASDPACLCLRIKHISYAAQASQRPLGVSRQSGVSWVVGFSTWDAFASFTTADQQIARSVVRGVKSFERFRARHGTEQCISVGATPQMQCLLYMVSCFRSLVVLCFRPGNA
jgi:hypothetical protein